MAIARSLWTCASGDRCSRHRTRRRRGRKLLKKERIKRRIYPNRETARFDVFDDIEMFYSPVRRLGSAGDLSPVEFERRYAQSGNRVSMKLWPVHDEEI